MTIEVDSNPPSDDQVVKYKPSEEDMKFFYERLLPFRNVFQWLSHSPKPTKDFTMREFAYEHRTGAYQRYNSFASQDEFKQSVILANPCRFEIGAVYSVNPRERKTLPKNALKPLSKELVFDIDLTDYDEIRTCCSETDICKRCWRFIQVAIKILDSALREDFGFNHLLWVFSGRRGAHCWISDPRARNLDDLVRKAIIEYLDVLGSKQSKMGRKLLNLKRPFHPHVERSFDFLKSEFIDIILRDQDPWNDNQAQIKELLSFLPEKSLQEELSKKWNHSKANSFQKWEDINTVARKLFKNQSQLNTLNEVKKDIIIYYLYPRLDAEVSKQIIHLLKSPFCIHPSTGNICVPFDPYQNLSGNPDDNDYGFNPMNAPNLKVLQNEFEAWETRTLNNYSTEGPELENSRNLSDYEKTSMKPYIDYFARFVNNLLKAELKGVSKRSREDDLEF